MEPVGHLDAFGPTGGANQLGFEKLEIGPGQFT
jgi:hypothetical protein